MNKWKNKEMSLGSEAEILEVARLPTCYQCRATFSSHFFLFCSVCNRHYCCVCVYSNLLCGCDRTRMSKVETKVKYKLRHICGSEYNRGNSNSPDDLVEQILLRFLSSHLTEIEAQTLFCRMEKLLCEDKSIYLPFKSIKRQIQSCDSLLINNMAQCKERKKKSLQLLAEVNEFFMLFDTVQSLKARPVLGSRNLSQLIYDMVAMLLLVTILIMVLK